MKYLRPIAIVLLLCVAGCKGQRCNTPIGEASATIDLTLPSYHALQHVGGSACLTGGYNGLFVIRTSLLEIKAYERACPYDHNAAVVADEEWGEAILTCPQCGSRFNVYADGVPLDGSLTKCPLYQYSTTLNGSMLTIW